MRRDEDWYDAVGKDEWRTQQMTDYEEEMNRISKDMLHNKFRLAELDEKEHALLNA